MSIEPDVRGSGLPANPRRPREDAAASQRTLMILAIVLLSAMLPGLGFTIYHDFWGRRRHTEAIYKKDTLMLKKLEIQTNRLAAEIKKMKRWPAQTKAMRRAEHH